MGLTSVINPPPLTLKERRVQHKIEARNKLEPIFNQEGVQIAPASPAVLRSIAKLQAARTEATWTDICIDGDMTPAKQAFFEGQDNWPSWGKRAVEMWKAAGYSMLSAPALLAKTIYHFVHGCLELCSKDKAKAEKAMLPFKDYIQDMSLVFKFVAWGAVKGTGLAIGAVFHDMRSDLKGDRAVLLNIDSQYGFLDEDNVVIQGKTYHFPNGGLPITGSTKTLERVDAVQRARNRKNAALFYSQDFHPLGHGSFAVNQRAETMSTRNLGGVDQTMWPVHCVQGSRDSAFAHVLEKPDVVVQKGANSSVDSYSAVQENDKRRKTALCAWLKKYGITPGKEGTPAKGRVFVYGFAASHCAGWSAEDLHDAGYVVTMLHDASAGLTDTLKREKMDALTDKGVEVITVDEAIHRYPRYFKQD